MLYRVRDERVRLRYAGHHRLREGTATVPKQAGPKRDKQKKNRIAAMKAEKDKARRNWRTERAAR